MDTYADSYSAAVEGNRWHVIIREGGDPVTIPVADRAFAYSVRAARDESRGIVEPCWGPRPCRVCDHPQAVPLHPDNAIDRAEVLERLSLNLSHHVIAAEILVRHLERLSDDETASGKIAEVKADLDRVAVLVGGIAVRFDRAPF